jgi:photosystem II stability/assembly factor-like uncharacterized protein
MKSSDGGQTWSEKKMPFTLLKSGYYKFFDLNNGIYVSLPDSSLLRTTDAGDYWEKLSLPSTSLFGISYFLNKKIGYIIDDNKFIKTTDGGDSWTQTNNFPYTSIASIVFF